jgi:hypothetical protein
MLPTINNIIGIIEFITKCERIVANDTIESS